jgi:polysaccharide export outer membrane protein
MKASQRVTRRDEAPIGEARLSPPRRRRFWALIAGALLAGCASGYDVIDERVPTPPPPRPYSSAQSLKQFDAAPQEPYRIGAGDQVSVQVWEKPELSGLQFVGPDGALTVPLVGSISVAGLTREDAAKAIRDPLSKLYTGVSVTLRVEQYQANRVTVVGKVKNPGVYRFDNAPSLLEAIAKAGGLAENALSPVTLSHCAVIRGRDRVAWIDLGSLNDGRDIGLNIRLRPEDMVLVPEDAELPVYVLGQVGKPGPIRWTRGMSFLDALAQAGGTGRDASPSSIYLVRPSQGKRYIISQGDILGPEKGTNVALERGDIIYVPTNFLADVGYLLEKLNIWSWVFVGTSVRNTGK